MVMLQPDRIHVAQIFICCSGDIHPCKQTQMVSTTEQTNPFVAQIFICCTGDIHPRKKNTQSKYNQTIRHKYAVVQQINIRATKSLVT